MEGNKVDSSVEVVVGSKLVVVTWPAVGVVVASVVVIGSCLCYMFTGWHTIKAFMVLK